MPPQATPATETLVATAVLAGAAGFVAGHERARQKWIATFDEECNSAVLYVGDRVAGWE